jgi:predicted aminopeptidase
MMKLSLRTWIRNAAAVFSGEHGAVTRQAQLAGCSRETVYDHAQKVEQRLAGPPAEDAVPVEARAEIQRLRQEVAALRRQAKGRVRLDKPAQRRLATTAFAMGLSLRQIEDVLALLLAGSGAKPPDHSTLGRWIDGQADRAGSVLKALDARCAPRVQTLALDEIFFGGDRPSSGSSH